MTVVHYGRGAFTACSLGRDGQKSADKSVVTCKSCKCTLKWETSWFS